MNAHWSVRACAGFGQGECSRIHGISPLGRGEDDVL